MNETIQRILEMDDTVEFNVEYQTYVARSIQKSRKGTIYELNIGTDDGCDFLIIVLLNSETDNLEFVSITDRSSNPNGVDLLHIVDDEDEFIEKVLNFAENIIFNL